MSERDTRASSAENGIGRIQRVALRRVWRHEAQDFTTWLEDNIDVLEDATGLRLSGVEREHPAGAFSVDLIAEDTDGRAVVIENQLEKSDHDHLGKLLTYLVGIQARLAIWIVADPRPEHVSVITWLNESSSADFYLLKIEAVRIGNSVPAPLLTQIAGPSEETREVGRTKKEMAERERLRYRFFSGLLEYAKSKTQLHANISPSSQGWAATGAGMTGVIFGYVARQHDARVELYMEARDAEENRRIFEALARNKDDIETEFGGSLEWQPLEGRKACRILHRIRTGGYRDEDKWKAVYVEMVDAMMKLASACKPHLNRISRG